MGGVSISIYPQISIHALREEGDFPAPQPDSRTRISIHALREEGDYMSICMITINMTFLSTPSARRATTTEKIRAIMTQISIHALREEGDPCR